VDRFVLLATTGKNAKNKLHLSWPSGKQISPRQSNILIINRQLQIDSPFLGIIFPKSRLSTANCQQQKQ
jgi:hypothetical protein